MYLFLGFNGLIYILISLMSLIVINYKKLILFLKIKFIEIP